MPYTIKKFNGQTLTVIEDGTVDTASTNLNLPGKNYAGYGKALNESLVYLLENFANSVEPSRKLTGQLWYDSTSKKIKIYDGTKFRSLGSIEYGTSAPENQVTGDQWFNTTTNQLFVWNGTAHKLIGPLQVGSNTSQLLSKRLLDDGGNTQNVLQAVVGTTTVAIFSESEFDIKQDQTPVTGFAHIYKGINLPSTVTYPNIQFAGVAKTSKSLLVNGNEISADQFVQNSSTNTQTMNSSLYVRVSPEIDSITGNFTSNRGLFVGVNQDLYLSSNSGIGYITNLTGDTLTFSVQSSGATKKIVLAQSNNFSPVTTNAIDLGVNGKSWKRVLAHNYFATNDGNEIGAFNGKVLGTTVSASEGFIGNLTGTLKGNLVRTNNNITETVVDVTGAIPIFAGRTNGEHYGSVINNNIQDGTLKYAIDTRGTDSNNNPITKFRGVFEGSASTSSSIAFGGRTYQPYLKGTQGSNLNLFNYTIALRDEDGRITATEFDGIATKAGSLWSPVGPGGANIACVASTNSDPYSIVVRDAAGNVNAGTITGTATNSQKLANALPSVPVQPSTIVQRDQSGDIYANLFQGVAVQANYADLAEKYLADAEYPIGTVMTIGGDAEVRNARFGELAIGVVSGSPAYLMNKDLTGGIAIALKGRVPAFVKGPVNKGDRLECGGTGFARVPTDDDRTNVFGMAIESIDDDSIQLIEILVL